MEYAENIRPQDRDAARMLAMESPILKDDPLTKQVVSTGIGANGLKVDLGNFLAAREAYLKLREVTGKAPDIMSAVVENSVRPDVEKWLN